MLVISASLRGGIFRCRSTTLSKKYFSLFKFFDTAKDRVHFHPYPQQFSMCASFKHIRKSGQDMGHVRNFQHPYSNLIIQTLVLAQVYKTVFTNITLGFFQNDTQEIDWLVHTSFQDFKCKVEKLLF